MLRMIAPPPPFGLPKVSEMATSYFALLNVSKMTTNCYDLFKVITMATIFWLVQNQQGDY